MGLPYGSAIWPGWRLSMYNTCSRVVIQCRQRCREIHCLSRLRPSGIRLASWMAAASFTSQASARQDWSTNLPSRSTRAELARLNFRPTHHTSEKDNTEHTSTTGLAARIASAGNSYTELGIVHVQKSYIL